MSDELESQGTIVNHGSLQISRLQDNLKNEKDGHDELLEKHKELALKFKQKEGEVEELKEHLESLKNKSSQHKGTQTIKKPLVKISRPTPRTLSKHRERLNI